MANVCGHRESNPGGHNVLLSEQWTKSYFGIPFKFARGFLQTRLIAVLGLAFGSSLGWSQAHSGFDLSQLDRAADPCVDFYQFACGGWRAKNPLPADRARYNRYEEMAELNLARMRTLLE